MSYTLGTLWNYNDSLAQSIEPGNISFLRAKLTAYSYWGTDAEADVITEEILERCKGADNFVPSSRKNEVKGVVLKLMSEKWELPVIIAKAMAQVCKPVEKVIDVLKKGTVMTHEEIKNEIAEKYTATVDAATKSRLYEIIASEVFEAVPDSPMGIDDVIFTFRKELEKFGNDPANYDYALNETIVKAGGPPNYIPEPTVTAKSEDNTLLYVGLGAVGLLVLYFMFK